LLQHDAESLPWQQTAALLQQLAPSVQQEAVAVTACAINVKANNIVTTMLLIFISIFLEVSLNPANGMGSLQTNCQE
jgi:hypothetical protein